MNLTEIKNETDAIYEAYRARFAGFARATRSVDEISGLIQRLESVVSAGENKSSDPALSSILDTARESLKLYIKERDEIVQAQKVPFAQSSARLAARANRVFDVYGRHYAGQDRSFRDGRLLADLIDELGEIQSHMEILVERGAEATRQDLDTVNSHLKLYNSEVDEMRQSRTQGTPDEQASRLAQLANSQFKLYNQHFAGKSRTTRRPELIIRMIENLNEYQVGMQALASTGVASQQNLNNIDTVQKNVEMYETELAEIRKIRQSMSASDLAGALGGAANETMAAYQEGFAGKDRASRDLELLGVLCDQLRDIFLQMNAIAKAVDLDFNPRNMGIVSEARGTYEAEWREVQQLKQ